MSLRVFGGAWVAMILDAFATGAAFMVAFWLRFSLTFLPDRLVPSLEVYIRFAIVVGVVSVVALQASGVYRKGNASLEWDDIASIFRGSALAFLLVAAISFLIRGGVSGVEEQSYSRLTIGISWILALLFLSGWRLCWRTFERVLFGQGLGITNVLVVGVNPTSVRFQQAVDAMRHSRYKVVGFVADEENGEDADVGELTILGCLAELPVILHEVRIHQMVAALNKPTSDDIARLMKLCAQSSIEFRSIPDVPSLLLSPARVEEVAGFPLFTPEEGLSRLRSQVAKRSLDLLLSTVLMVIGAPLGLCLAVLVSWSSNGTVFFPQERVGKDGRRFRMYKFRSMVHDAEEQLEELRMKNVAGSDPVLRLRNDPRVTPIGRFMRSLSLDELPQLINVIKGEMSLVGPRPHVPYEVDHYSEWHKRRHDVLPGITGLTQVSGRRALALDDMIKLDIYYIENWSVWLDLRIMLQTIPIVLSGRGAY